MKSSFRTALKVLGVSWLLFSSYSLANEKPNILWISAEDMGPHLGAYGDPYALQSNTSPNIDDFAKQSLTFTKVSSNAPVCAVARTTLIAGVHASSIGNWNMRARIPVPKWLELFPKILQKNGYYTTNNLKEDYNFYINSQDAGWDDSSKLAHWKNTPKGKPFFSVFNFQGSHESRIRSKHNKVHHKPENINLAPYYPDIKEVKKDWARYYDGIKELDDFFARKITELKKSGLYDNTIVFFWADHGSGMPRHKRYIGWSGLHVPLIIHVPEKFRHLAPKGYKAGAASPQLLSFVDFAPTLLSIAGASAPEYYQGRAFMGKNSEEQHAYLYGYRGRMDESVDDSRSLTDGKYLYIRNFMPHKPHGQYIKYQQLTQSTNIWYKLHQEGKLNPVQSMFWQVREQEELYNLEQDPHEINNLAGRPEERATLKRFRAELKQQMVDHKDLVYLPEPFLYSETEDKTYPQKVIDGYRKNQSEHIDFMLSLKDVDSPSLVKFKSLSNTQQYWYLQHLKTLKVETGDTEKILRHANNLDDPILKLVSSAMLLNGIEANNDAKKEHFQKILDSIFDEKKDFMFRVYALNELDEIENIDYLRVVKGRLIDEYKSNAPAWGNFHASDLLERIKGRIE